MERGLENMKKTTFTATELSSESGVPQRTIRYYISRGLLSHPIRRGAKAEYDESHLKDLREIRELQKKGLTLDKISGILSFRRQGYLSMRKRWKQPREGHRFRSSTFDGGQS